MIGQRFTPFALAALVLTTFGCSSLQKKPGPRGKRSKTPTTSNVSRKGDRANAAKPTPEAVRSKPKRAKEVEEIVTRDGFR